MIPINDEEPGGRRIMPINTLLIIINVLVFLYELALGPQLDAFIQNFGAVPKEILTGVDVPPAGPFPLWITLITSTFIHAGWLHIIGNMIYLFVFGDDIEEAFGPIWYLIFYLAMGIIAGLAQSFISGPGSTIPGIGASGAIAGVLGAYLVFYPGRKVHVIIPPFYLWTTRVSAIIVLGFWFVLQFLTGITALSQGAADSGGVAVFAHIGGFVAGAFIALLLRGRIGHTRQVYG